MATTRNWIGIALLALVASTLAGCGGGSSSGGGGEQDPGTATVGASGGTVAAVDGAQVSIPPDAFAEPVTVRISRDSTGAPSLPATLRAAGPVYAITPHGGDFRRHVEVTIPLPAQAAAVNEQRVLVTAEAGGNRWTVLSGATPVGNALRVPVMHFSFFQIVTLDDLRTPTVTLVVDRLASVPVPGTTQVSADHTVTYSTDDWHEFTFEARVVPPADPVSLRGRAPPATPRLCRPADLGPAGGRIVVRREGAVASDVGLGHHAPAAAQSAAWPRNRLEAAPQGFLDTTLQGSWALFNGPGVAHFWGQDQPRSGAWVELARREARGLYPLTLDRYTLPPAGNAAYDDELNWFGSLGLGIQHNGRIRIDASVATDCGFDVSAVPLAFRLQMIDPGANSFVPGVQPVRYEGEPRLSGSEPKRVVANLGEDVGLSFWNLLPSNAWDEADDSNVSLQEVDSIAWEASNDGVVWRPAPELAPSVSVFTEYANPDPFNGPLYLNHSVMRIYTMRFAGVGPGRAGWYRANACVRLVYDDPLTSAHTRTTVSRVCQPSRPYRLEVVSNPPAVTRQPVGQTVLVGETASLSVTVGGGAPLPDLQWQKLTFADAFLRRPWSNIPGATGTGYTTPAVTLADHPTYYRVVASNASGAIISDVATVSVVDALSAPSVVAQPGSLNVNVGGTGAFAATVTGSAPLSYQWRRNGVDIAGANAPLLTLANVTAANDGNYTLVATNRAGSITTEPAALVVTLGTPVPLAPSIASPPVALAVPAGSAANFAVAVTGTGPYSYVWTREGEAQPVGSAPILPFAAVQPGDAGRYQVRVTNNVGTVLSAYAQLSVGPSTQMPVAPSIVTPPAAAAVFPGAAARFVVAAAGSGPLVYQWRRDGADISGATTAVLTIAAASGGDTGQYSVEVRNAAGAVLSAPAALVIIGAPVIDEDPVSTSRFAGDTVTFRVEATGDALRYQWTRNNVAIAGATAPTYTTPPLTLGDSGSSYAVIVYNGAGLLISAPGVLTVSSGTTPGMTIFAGDFSAGGGGGSADGTGTAARFDFPEGLTADAAGNLYVATSNGSRVRKIDAGASVTTIALQPGVGSLALAPNGDLFSAAVDYCGLARISPPLAAGTAVATIGVAGCTGISTRGAAVDRDGVLYLAMNDTHSLLRLTPAPQPNVLEASLLAGSANADVAGSQDGTGAAARFNGPRGMAFGPDGNLYVADSGNHTIRRITPAGVVSTFAGSAGNYGLSDATGADARFFTPTDLAFDAAGNLLVLQRGDPANPQAYVRRVTVGGVVTTLFDATAESVALAGPGQGAFAAAIRGMAVRADGRIALAAGNAILLRTLP